MANCASQDDNVVWYSFTMPAGQENANLLITGTGGSPIVSPALTVYGGSCAGLTGPVGFACSNSLALTCLVPGTTYLVQLGTALADAGNYSINITYADNGVANDACANATAIAFATTCDFVTVNGTTNNACPESFVSACNLNNFPTVWYSAVLPAGGIGFGFENITGGANINVFSGTCASLTQQGGCITADTELKPLTPGTYLIGVRNTDPGAVFSFDIKTIVPPANDLCANAVSLTDNTAVNGTTACATPFATSFCGLSTTTSHTVFYRYTVPAGNTTNTDLEITISPNTLTTGTAAQNDINIGLFTNCAGTVYNASVVAPGDLCTALGTTITLECVAPGTVINIAVGSADGDEGDFSINVNEISVGIPANDLCTAPTTINFGANCDFITVNGTTVNACPELFTGSACMLDNFPTVWFTAVIPAGGIGFGFENLVGNPNINILNNVCTPPTQFGTCITTDVDITNLTPGTYHLAVRTDAAGNPFSFDIKTIVPQPNYLCSAAVTLSDNVAVNGSNGCAPAFTTSYCGLSTTTSHTVFYKYTVPAGNTTNVDLEFTINPNTATTGTAATNDINIGLFTDCAGTVYNASVATGDLCTALGNTVKIECVAPGTVLNIAVGSSDGNEGDFSITVNETNVGIPTNDLCVAPIVINFSANCDFTNVNGNSLNACPETVSGGACDLLNFPTVWYRATLPAGGVGFGFTGLSAGLNLAIFQDNCPTLTQVGTCITSPVDVTTGFTAGSSYLIGVRNTDPGAPLNFQIKTIVPPANDLCANAVALSDNTPVNGTTACATPFNVSYCGLSTTTSHTVFYSYTVPSGNTTNTNLEFTITPNTATTGNAAQNDINIGLFTNCGGTVYNASVESPGNLCTALGSMVRVECVAPGTVLTIAIGSSNGDEGDFSINVNETNVGVPTNDLCVAPNVISIVSNCEFQPVTGTTLDACPENFAGGACALNNFPTVWYSVVLPAGGIGLGFEDLTPGLNIAVFNNACPNPTQIGPCVTSNTDLTTGFAPGTYLIAVRNANPGTNFSFDIKTILFLANDDPCSPGFVATSLTNAVPLANQDNNCATDDNTCAGAPVQNTLWYSFTLGAGFDRITINVTGLTSPSIGLYNQANPCNQTPLNEECNGDGMVEFNCLLPGTYLIMVGTSAVNANMFTITATQGNNAGPVNDFCNMATPITIQPTDLCIGLPFTSSNLNACPEPGLTSFGMCNFQTEETSWYTFTAPGMAGDMPTMDFTFTSYTGAGTPFMGLFTGTCGALTTVTTSCLSGLNTVFGNIGPLIPGQTYYIALSSFGDTGGNSMFEVKFNLGPPNDDKCHTASGYDLGTGGTLSNQTNDCAGGDYTITDCPPNDSQNSVWYTFTVAPGSYGINIFIDQVLNNGNPLLGPIAAGVFPDGCGSNLVDATLCFPAKTDQVIDCLEPGTYDLQISTSSANAGEFHITISQLVDNRMCPADNYSPNLSDKCDDAIVINMGGIVCEDILVKGCNQNACPEDFNSAGCAFSTDPTVWYEFTVDANASTVDITTMSGGYNYAILVGDPCTEDPPSALAGYTCLSAANTTNIPVTGGTTYYLIVSNPTGGNFSFNIRQNALPENDDPIISSPRPPYELTLGGGHSSTTCCAIGFNDDPSLDYPNVNCAGATNDGAVWYTYTTGSEIGVQIEVSSSGANPISGNTTVEVLSGSATAPSGALFSPTSVSCGSLPAVIKLSCYDPGETLWIKVASDDNECGDFSVILNELSRCQQADECDEIGGSQMIGPTITDPNCGAFVLFNADGCLESACPQADVSDCGFGNNPTVWFQVTVDEEAVQLVTQIATSGTWQPVWAIYSGDCTALTLVPGGTIAMPTGCSNGDTNPGEHSVGVVEGIDTYYIAVSGEGIIDDPNFQITLYSAAGCVSCIGGTIGCNTTATFNITQRSSDRPLNDPFFCQGEDVTVCINYLYDASDTGVDWFHGLIPDFGPGWDLTAFDPTAVTVSPGNPEWNDETDGACAPFITEQMPLLCTYTDPVTGRLKMCNLACQPCPCSAPLLQGSPLPSGWFWSTNGGAGCENDCSPSTHYGIGSVIANISFCVDLKVREFDNEADCIANRSLHFNFQTTSDGVSGCWNDPVAECKLDKAQIGPNWQIDCDRPPKILGDDFELCHEGMVNIELTNEDGSGSVTIIVNHIPNADVSGANDFVFTGGSGTIDDYLISSSTGITIQQYEAYADAPNIQCPAPRDTFDVIIYPELLVVLPVVNICAEDTDGEPLVPNVTGGTGNYVNYQWSNGQNTPSITVFYSGPTTYSLTVTDDKGCSGTATVDVNKLVPLSFDIDPETISSCANDVQFNIENIVTNGNPVIAWNVPPQLFFTDQGTTLSINLPFSDPSFSPYTITATITDQYGCFVTREAMLDIVLPPSVELGYIPPGCNVNQVDLIIQNYVTQSGNSPTFKLLDCFGNQLFGDINGTFGPYISYDPNGIFEDVDMSLTNCFKLLVEEEGGCSFVTPNLTVPITTGTPVQLSPAVAICSGNSTTISVTNPAAFAGGSFNWTPSGTGPSFSVSPTATTQYAVTATQANGCTSVASVIVTVRDLPVPGISGSTTFCAGESTQLNASGGTSYNWQGPGGFTANTASTGPINVSGTYTVTVTDVNGCTATETETIAQSTSLTVVIAPLTICDNAAGLLDAGPGFTTYQWTDATNTVIGNSQTVSVTQAGTYTVSVTQGTCMGTGTGTVTNNTTPTINLPATLTVCRLNTGIGPTTIDFVALGDTMTGQWFNIDNAAVNTGNWGNIDFTTTPAADTFRFVYVTNTAVLPCVDVTDTLSVIVNNCPCPTPALNSPAPLCNSRPTPFNLNSLFIGAPLPGAWTVIAPSPTPFPTIVNGNINVTGIQEGVYTLRYTYNPPSPGNCDKFIDISLSVFGASSVTGSNVTLCNQNIGSGPVSVNLNTLLSNLTEPSPGSWVQIDGPTPGGTLPNVDVTGMAVDTLRFRYTTTAVAPCMPQTAVVEVRIRDCNCPLVTLIADTLCNGSAVPLDLQNPSRFIVDPVSTTGTWTITSPATISSLHFVNPSGLASGTYVATYTISGSLPAGCTKTFTKNVVIRNQPVAQVDKAGTACSANTGNGATTIGLFSLLKPGYSNGGTWTQVSPATPVLTIPANGIVDFNGQAINTVFTFRYTVNATSPCQNVQADVVVTVKDCNCPDTEIDCANCDLCNDNDVLNLINTIVNPATFGTGTWTVTGPGNVNIPLTNVTILDAMGLAAGTYKARHTLNPAPAGNCPKFDEFTFLIRNKATAVVNPDTLVCNGQNGITNFPISSLLISGGAGGRWEDEDGVALTNLNPSIVGLPEGSTLNYSYIVPNAAPCTDSRYPVTISITMNCNCEQINLLPIPPTCTNAGTIDLKAFSDPKPGTWTATNPLLVITNGVLTLTNVPAGIYQLTYTLTNPEPNCPTSKSINITLSNPKSAGTARGAEFCLGATDVVNLFDRLDSESTGGVWSVVSGGSAGFNAATGTFNLTGRPAGTYIFKYSFTNQAPCPNDEEEVTIKINPLPVADAGLDKNIDCTVQSAVLGTDLTSTGTNIVYEWKLNGNVIASTIKYTATMGGDYTLSVMDTVTKCTSSDMVKVIQADDLPIFDIKVDTIACFGQTATITLSNIRGGKSPYQVSFDGGKTYGSVLIAANLKAGTYKVQVKDANGCVNDQLPEIKITEPPLFTVNLGNDFFLTVGEDSLLSIKGQYNEATAKSVTWKANGVEIASAKNLPEITVKPEEDTEYNVTVINQSGCIATDNLRISIRRVKPECVPNIFTPNNEGANNFFSINCFEVEKVTKYRIYDRWGNLLFTGENLLPDQPQTFWDGKFKGKEVVPGVYVYYLEMLFKDGSTEKRGGDVTVLR